MSDYPEVRLAPGSRLRTGEQELVVGRRGRTRTAGWSQLEGVDDRTGARAAGRGGPLSAEPIDDPDALWVHELDRVSGGRGRAPGVERGRVVAVIANPAHDLLELDSGALVPIVFVRRCEDGVTARSTRPRASSTVGLTSGGAAVRIDVFTIFPALVDGVLPGEPARQGPRRRAARPALPRPARAHHRRAPHGRRHALRRRRRHGDAARADLRQRRGRRPAPPAAACSARAVAASTRRWPASWPAATGFSLLCGRYEGVDHRVREHLVDGELSIGDVRAGRGRGRRLRRDRGGHPAAARASWATSARPSARAFGAGGGCSRSPSTPARPSSGAGRCPRCCARATTAAIARWRRAQALHRTLRDRPDLIEARGGLSDEDDRGCWKSSPRRLSLSVPLRDPLFDTQDERAMKSTDLVDQQPPHRHPRLRPRRRGEGARPGRGGQPRACPGLPGQRHRPLRIGRAGDLHRPQGQLPGRRRAHLPAPLADHRQARVVLKRGDVRRAKLYYLRERTGKAAKIKEKRED